MSEPFQRPSGFVLRGHFVRTYQVRQTLHFPLQCGDLGKHATRATIRNPRGEPGIRQQAPNEI